MFLLKTDFYQTFTETRFNQLIKDDDSIWENNLPKVIEDVSGYLRARYDVTSIFNSIEEFDFTAAYAIGARILFTAETYDDTSTYSTGELVVYSGSIYECTTDILTPEAWNASNWEFKALDQSLFYCIEESTANLPTDTAYFTAGDARNLKLVEVVVDIVIYNILNRLNNIDIPANRKERYDGNDGKQLGGAIGWLKSVQRGNIEPNLPLLEANQENQTGNIVMHGYAVEITTKNTSF